MLHRAPQWHGASTLLLVVAVAAATLGLGAMAAGIAVEALLVPTLPPVEHPPHPREEGTPLREHMGSGPGERVRSARAGPARTTGLGPSVAAMPRTLGASGSTVPPDGAATQPPSDDDPRGYLAHMTAVQHRQGLPLPGAVGRLQSLIITATPVAP